jgi:flagellar biosynthesis protein FliP
MFKSNRQPQWLMLTIILLTLFCLNQNRAAGSLLCQQITTNNFSNATLVNDYVEPAQKVAFNTDVKRCELSEKSLRLCLDQLSIIPLLLVLFTLSVSFLIVVTFIRFINATPFLPPKRIHLSLCRFQE